EIVFALIIYSSCRPIHLNHPSVRQTLRWPRRRQRPCDFEFDPDFLETACDHQPPDASPPSIPSRSITRHRGAVPQDHARRALPTQLALSPRPEPVWLQFANVHWAEPGHLRFPRNFSGLPPTAHTVEPAPDPGHSQLPG